MATMLIAQRETAIIAYREFCDSGKRVKQAEKVFKAFELMEFASDWEVHLFTDIGIRQVSARRSELGDRIIEAGRRKDKGTENNVIIWKVNPFPSLFPAKRITAQQKRKMVVELCKEHPGELADRILKVLQ